VASIELPQSISIARFLAKRFHLAGANDLDEAKTDAVVDTVVDLQNAYINKVFTVKEDEKEAAKKKFLAEELAGHLEKIEKILNLFGRTGFSVGSSLTWSDLAVFNLIDWMVLVNIIDTSYISAYPHILSVYRTVDGHPKIAEYIRNRPKSAF
jgi:glutathione S-transferase